MPSRLPARTLAALLALAPGAVHAGAWTRDAGEGVVRLSYGVLAAERYYGADFERVDIPRYRQEVVGLFAEVGVIDRWLTLSLSGTPYRRSRLAGAGSAEGVGDLQLAAWTGLIVERGLRVSAGLLAGVPAGDSDQEAPGAPAAFEPRLPNGDGELDLEARVAVGSGLPWLQGAWPLRHYVEAEVGFRWHAELHDVVTYGLKVGAQLPYGVFERVWLTASVFGVESLATRRDVEPVVTGSGDGVTFTAVAAELSVRLLHGLEVFGRVDGALRARALPSALVATFGVGGSF